MRKANLKLSTDIDPDLSSVMADSEQLQRVFLNLANNVQEAMHDGGELTVYGTQRDGQVEISFTDTGSGIADEYMDKLLRPLFTTKSGGTGLGLAVCQEITNKHGGTLDVTNNAGSKGGATLAVMLPTM